MVEQKDNTTTSSKLRTAIARPVHALLGQQADSIVHLMRSGTFYTLCCTTLIALPFHFLTGWIGSVQPIHRLISLGVWLNCAILLSLFIARKISLKKAFTLLVIITQIFESCGIVIISLTFTPATHNICSDNLLINEIDSLALFFFSCMGLARKASTIILGIFLVSVAIAYSIAPTLVGTQFLTIFIYVMVVLWLYSITIHIWFSSSSREITDYQHWQQSILSLLHINKVELLTIIQLCRQSIRDTSTAPSQLNNLTKSTRESLIRLGLYLSAQQKTHLEDLHSVFPSLSPMELEVCHLVVKGLSMKEIATATHRSLSNIGTVRGNIRKKLALPGDADLRQYLQKKIKST